MEYCKYKEIFDKHLLLPDVTTYVKDLVKDNTSFARLTTSFNVKSFIDRLQSNYLTSVGIKLGDALEDAFKQFLIENGAIFLPRNFVKNRDCDQIFQYGEKTFLIEQKIRDDHDSSKKVGQIENYKIKKDEIKKKVNSLSACSWFIDPDFAKNKSYYLRELSAEELYYGQEIEQFLKNYVFFDDRCKGFFQELLNSIETYTEQFSLLNIASLKINYKDFTITELFRLLKSKKHHPQIAQIFFEGSIPFKEIYEYVEKGRSVPCKEDFKLLLKECIIDGESI